MENKKVLIRIQNLKQYFPIKKRSIFQRERLFVKANDGITLDIFEGETFGLVGESGCGKSTLGRTILQLYNQTDGSTLFYGRSISELAPKYVGEVIKSIPDGFPKYLNEKKIHEASKVAAEKIEDSVEKAAAEEKVLNREKSLNNMYLNMLRIAGGLLVHPDLKLVSNQLQELHQHLEKTAVINRKLRMAKKKLEAGELDEKLSAKVVVWKDELAKLMEFEKPIRVKLAELHAQAKNQPLYAEFVAFEDNGIDLSRLTREEMRELRSDMQVIFQDPYSSLNPRLTVGQIIGEGLLAHDVFKDSNSEKYTEYITKVMDQCGLAPYFIHRYPHQFSGGQRQRIGIARALALNPKFIVCDEAVSALDVSIQSQIINLLSDLKKENNLTYLFITHDLSVVKYISDRIGVMYLGNMVELATSDQIFENPLHPYTEALLEAIPRTDVVRQELTILEGDIPSPIKPPKGCKFHTRCRYAFDKCKVVTPKWEEIEPGHFVACHLRSKDADQA